MPTCASAVAGAARAPRLRHVGMMRADRLDHLRLDAQHRIERHHRVLENHRDALAAERAQRAPPAAARGPRPRSRMRPPTMRPGGSTRPMIEKPVTDLPQPDSPTRPSTSPRVDREAHAVDRLHDAGAREEMGLQVLDREQRRRSPALIVCSRGLRTSRRRSPTRLIDDDRDQQRDAGEEADPVLAAHHVFEAVGDQQAERRLGDGQADAEEGERRLERDRVRHLHRQHHDQRRQAVRQQVVQHDARRRRARGSARPRYIPCAARPAPSRGRCARNRPTAPRPAPG